MAETNDLQKKAKTAKKKQKFFSGDIVFIKNGSIQTIPSLTKRLKDVTEPLIGLQFIWEYRSPTKSVVPHYLCRLCQVQGLQNEMVAHCSGWKHCFRYMKRKHPEKVPHDESAPTKDSTIKKAVRVSAAEVERAEGRGHIRVMIKEPSELTVFRNMKSSYPSQSGPGSAGLLGPAPSLSDGAFDGCFPEPPFLGNFPPRGPPASDFPPSMHGSLNDGPMRTGPSDMGRHPSPGRYGNPMPGSDRLRGSPDSMQRFPDGEPMRMGSGGFGMVLRSEGMGRPYPSDLPMNSGCDQMIGSGPKSPEPSNTLPTLLKYLDTFHIENEDDAQIVLKITQKLTDILMEYRLRSISSIPLSVSSSLGNMSYSSNSRFSGNSMTGPSRFYN